MSNPTQQDISTALARNRTNLHAWAKESGYKYKTVFYTVKNWAGRDDRSPHGGLARLIMQALEGYVNESQLKISQQVDHSNNEVDNLSGQLDLLVDHLQLSDK